MSSIASASGAGGSGFRPQWIQGILSYYDPDDIDSLRRSDGRPVTGDMQGVGRWMDRCGNQQCYDLYTSQYPPVGTEFPVYRSSGISSLPAIDFVGATDGAGSTSALYNSSFGSQIFSQFTIMMVAQIYQSAAGTLSLLSAAKVNDTPPQTANSFIVQTHADLSTVDFLKDTSSVSGGFTISKRLTTNPALYTFIVDDTTSPHPTGIFYLNGGTAAVGSDANASSTMTLDGICFGGRYVAPIDQPLKFKARDLAIYSRRLLIGELNQLGTWMMAKSAALGSLSPFI